MQIDGNYYSDEIELLFEKHYRKRIVLNNFFKSFPNVNEWIVDIYLCNFSRENKLQLKNSTADDNHIMRVDVVSKQLTTELDISGKVINKYLQYLILNGFIKLYPAVPEGCTQEQDSFLLETYRIDTETLIITEDIKEGYHLRGKNIDGRQILPLDDIEEQIREIKMVEFMSTSDFERYASGGEIYFYFTEKGELEYLVGSTLKLKKNIEQKMDVFSSDAKSAKNRINSIEKNIFTFMGVFIALFALIGINFSYIADLIVVNSIFGVFALNGSIVVTITLIFMLVDYLRIDYIYLANEEVIKGWKKKKSGYSSLIIIELVITSVFLIFSSFMMK
ncbi:hypothetical protein SANA_22680 [Gottschalkiaceae bacterium SANA]|nr:hypothetical protein SANA_22680 [Gottschalkiaceae bacterium SANA]